LETFLEKLMFIRMVKNPSAPTLWNLKILLCVGNPPPYIVCFIKEVNTSLHFYPPLRQLRTHFNEV
jgi:hypothetical protein